MQEGRLFKIVYYLLEKGQATAPELAEKLEVSVRTIYRDIDTLSEAGIPVYAETGRNGGIRLMDHFILSRVLLSEEEKQEMLAALQSLGAIKGGQGGETLNKLTAFLDTGEEGWLEVDFSRWGNHQGDNGKFVSLKSAIIGNKCVRIVYASSYEETSKRTIWPLKLSYKSRAWYLKAYCTERKDFRIFKLSRILEWEVLEESFISCHFPEEEVRESNFPEAGFPHEEYPVIVLRFPKEMAYRVYDEFSPEEVKRMENGDLLVRSRMPEDAWLIGFLLSFLGEVEVVEPIHLKDVLARQIEKMYEKQKG